jgi:hypothetical protein
MTVSAAVLLHLVASDMSPRRTKQRSLWPDRSRVCDVDIPPSPLALPLECLSILCREQAGLRGAYVQRDPANTWPEHLPMADVIVPDFDRLAHVLLRQCGGS